ncbi:alpha/beta hydrolase [Salibacterium salarium]|uniref:Alpha/beta hydrolase n=1 Tax=Salibacterium salarium TaxID=284579 RepID=A0A428MWD3_9BACI|nr:alpha/beta hydrolase [Salibacterium salarium]RSL30470.1 alpha/beta hydrolase [Salibacterium salarium]
MPFFTSQGATLHYQTWGHGLPLFFIHPPAMGAATFQQQQKLSRDYKVVFMDARGHGFSNNGKGTLSVSEWALDLYHLADELGVKKVVLCGYSSGGSVALEFALNWPERTAGVVTVGGFPEVCTTLLEREFDTGIWLAQKEWMGVLAKILSYSNAHTTSHRQAIADTIQRSHAPLVKSLYESGLHYTCTHRLSQLQVPLLLIYGMRDWYVHYYQYLFYKYASHAPIDVVMVEKVGHQVPTLQPNEYNAIVHRFAAVLNNKTGI